jgi:3-oxoacyl-[acyl-carrier-protein] synthase-3
VIDNSIEVVIEKFKAITGIKKRRYIIDDQTVVDIAIVAAKKINFSSQNRSRIN